VRVSLSRSRSNRGAAMRGFFFSRGQNEMTRVRWIAPLLAAVAVLAATSAFALDYPTRPIKWIVPYPPAGTTDVLARIMAKWLSDHLGQQVIVENKPGGGNNIGTELALHSPP